MVARIHRKGRLLAFSSNLVSLGCDGGRRSRQTVNNCEIWGRMFDLFIDMLFEWSARYIIRVVALYFSSFLAPYTAFFFCLVLVRVIIVAVEVP